MTTTLDKADAPRGADKKEAFHREAEGRAQPFAFTIPDNLPGDKKALLGLCRSDILRGSVQIVPDGGDNNLHYHPGADGFWMVLKGKARYYGPDGLIGEYGRYEGIMIPRNARYWFETADPDEPLQLLHISGHTQRQVGNSRINVDPEKPGYTDAVRFDFPEGQNPPAKAKD